MNNNENKNSNIFIIATVIVAFIILVAVVSHLINISTNQSNNSANANVIIYSDTVRKININTATKAELMTLPSIGEEKANSIIKNRPYFDKWDIVEVDGIGSETVKNIIDLIEV